MAKKSKAPRAGIPPALRRPLLAAAAVIALLVGVLLLWQGYQGWRQASIAPELVALRDGLASGMSKDIAKLRGRLGDVA